MGLISASRDRTRSLLLASALVLGSVCLITILFWQGMASLVNYAYPTTALVVGLWLYGTRPALYLGFTWWIWFVTPFVRRLVDYGIGHFTPTSPVMLAPYLVTGIAVLTLFRAGKRLARRDHVPFLLLLLGIGYGYLIGLIKVGPMSAIFGALNWLLPVLLALHVYLLPGLAEAHKKIVAKTFAWGVLVMGVYGLLQYVSVPPWDAQWLLDSDMWITMGRPEDGQIRIFSTLNSTGPFAYVLVAGLLLLFSNSNTVGRLAAAPGYFSLLFSLVRSAWGGWFVGLAYLAWRLKGKLRMRLVGLLAVTAMLSIPLFMLAPNTDRATERAATLTNLEEDASFRTRVGIHRRGATAVLRTPIGRGVGAYGPAAKLSKGGVASIDSGIFAVVLTLGWIGTLLYVSGLGWLLGRLFRLDARLADPFVTSLTAVTFAFMAMMIFLNQLNGVTGAVVWPFLALALTLGKHSVHPAEEPVIA